MEKDIKIGNKEYRLASDDDYLNAVGDDFEPHMVALFRTLVASNDVVFDVGANIGLTAILFSTLAHKVVAFEPSPSTFKVLEENLARAKAKNVDAINLGIGDKGESLTITYAKNNRSGGFISNKTKPTINHITEKVRIETLDDLFLDGPVVPNFIKIDVEGFEVNALKGGITLLLRYKPIVVFEMNHFCLGVLQRITIPDFLDFGRSIFPFLYAIDADNANILDMHDADLAYFVMHEHVVRHRFPNLVGGFDSSIKTKLDQIAKPL